MRALLACSLWLCLLVLVPGRSGAATATVAIVSSTAGQPANLRGVEQLLIEAVRGAGFAVLAPAQVAARLSGPDWTPARARAAALLRAAATLVRQVDYDEALRKLESAETSALEGLANLLDPKLLAEIYYQRGIALLPTDEEAAQRYLVQSLSIQPSRLAGRGVSPKITAALRRAALTATRTPPAPPSVADGARATAALGVRYLLVLDGRQHSGRGSAAAGLFLYDAEQQSWSTARVATGDSDAVPRSRVQEAVRGLLPGAQRPAQADRPATSAVDPRAPGDEPAPRSRRVLPWIATAVGVGLLAAGTALVFTARSRADEYQSLANADPLVEYDSRPRELEESGRRMSTAGIVCLAVGAAAGVAAIVLWLLPSRSPARADEARWSPPGMLRFTFSGP